MVDLDKIDRQLLRLLQDDGRLSNAELSEKVHISQATCHRRVNRLFESGLIRSVHAQIAPKAVNLGTLVIVGVVLDRSTPQSFADFEQAITQLPMILDCQLVAGEFDYLLRVRVKDIEDFNDLHAKQLIALPAVRQIRTFFVMKEVIDSALLQF
ncbi:Lrp/AsnC family transcriptional regulator [Celerinatantimonas diazotrophica]|uniref:Leucine-responsive regulatory protein n=1 Tax=Celerinatantimonas diazotrophica TaxID=412034 RepID=A0A4R1K3Z6_9GAMM|nr:Lrp/AsnC family transcriptional regulator [Celerinatantimonas diazotrophica]TCK58630.1 AsnC family transcriptional regulator [Celerinatantimonas diazotrophica]CAG9297259.1 Leucine-responsive regulatory protein [Celerinatantimonas diazotrophica]